MYAALHCFILVSLKSFPASNAELQTHSSGNVLFHSRYLSKAMTCYSKCTVAMMVSKVVFTTYYTYVQYYAVSVRSIIVYNMSINSDGLKFDGFPRDRQTVKLNPSQTFRLYGTYIYHQCKLQRIATLTSASRVFVKVGGRKTPPVQVATSHGDQTPASIGISWSWMQQQACNLHLGMNTVHICVHVQVACCCCILLQQ